MQFKTTGELRITVSDLRFKLGCTTTLRQYTHLRQRAIDHAIKEINSQWTLDVAYEEIKTRRTVIELLFTFKPTFTRKSYDPVRKKMRTQLSRPRRKTKEEITAEKSK